MLKFFLSRKKNTDAPKPETANASEPGLTEPLAAPAYYEVWGGLESANRALWVGLWCSCTFAVLALLLLRSALRRPPVVIRLDPDGQVQVIGGASGAPVQAATAPSQAEIENFVSLFERFFTELNCYTCDADLKQAFFMMTPEFQQKAQEQLNRNGSVAQFKAQKLHTSLVITEITVKDETAQAIDCHVRGYRDIGSYMPGVAKHEVVFEDDIVLKEVPRSEQAPYGLLVEDYAASYFKR